MSENTQMIRAAFEKAGPKLAEVMPSGLTPERFTRIAIGEIMGNPNLAKASPATLLKAVMDAARLGLSVGGAQGEAYLVPYKGAVQCQIGYRGLLKLARRSGEIAGIAAEIVREGDPFRYDAAEQRIWHTPDVFDAEREARPIIGAYAIATLKSGERQTAVMSRAEIERIRQGSQGRNAAPWSDHWAEMAKKTALRRLCKMLPMEVEAAVAIDRDDRAEYPQYARPPGVVDARQTAADVGSRMLTFDVDEAAGDDCEDVERAAIQAESEGA